MQSRRIAARKGALAHTTSAAVLTTELLLVFTKQRLCRAAVR
jgi:hypothetical protein